MTYSTFEMESCADGVGIVVHAWAAESPRGGIVISHGAAEHALRYARFADVLNRAGLCVWAPDHRGHGRSVGEGGLGDFGEAGWPGLVSDLRQVFEHVRDLPGGQPLALFGHSMGSFAVQQLIADAPEGLGAVVLSGSTAIAKPASGERPAVPRFNDAFEPARTPYDWLSRDEAEVDAYVADPLCGFEQRRGGGRVDFTALAREDLFGGADRALPVLLLSGDEDPIHRGMRGLQLLEQRLRDGGIAQVDTQYYVGGRHEMLNETNRDEVMAAARDWMLVALGFAPV